LMEVFKGCCIFVFQKYKFELNSSGFALGMAAVYFLGKPFRFYKKIE
jgi:hypothetical protein